MRRCRVPCVVLVSLSELLTERHAGASGPAAWHAGARSSAPPPLALLGSHRPSVLRLGGGGGQGAGRGEWGAEGRVIRELQYESQEANGRYGSAGAQVPRRAGRGATAVYSDLQDEYDDDDEYGRAQYRGGVAKDPADTDFELERAAASSEYEESVPWAERDTTYMKMRREEEERLVSEFGGDLSVLAKDTHKLRRRRWDDTANTTLVSHAARKRREEAEKVKAAGGELGSVFAKPKPNAFQRDMLEWQAAGLDKGYISAKERRQSQELDAAKAFGEHIETASISDKIKLRQQEWDMQQGSTTEAFIPTKERKRLAEARAAQEFGGELGSCLLTSKNLSKLEREKLNSRYRRKKKQ